MLLHKLNSLILEFRTRRTNIIIRFDSNWKFNSRRTSLKRCDRAFAESESQLFFFSLIHVFVFVCGWIPILFSQNDQRTISDYPFCQLFFRSIFISLCLSLEMSVEKIFLRSIELSSSILVCH